MSLDLVDRWILVNAALGTILMLLGTMTLWVVKHPSLRVQIIQCVFIACTVAPVIHLSNVFPAWSLAVYPADRASSLQPKEMGTSIPIGEKLDSVEGKPVPRLRDSQFSTKQGSANSEPCSETWYSRQSVSGALKITVRTVYLIGLASVLVYLGFGFYHRRRVLHGCLPASPLVEQVLHSIATNRFRSCRLLVSSEIDTPLMWGCFRPTIVIPKSLAESGMHQYLQFSLAHEWSHVERYDFAAHYLSLWTRIFFFYQPLYWSMHKHLLLGQDALADAFTASRSQDAIGYAEFLLKLARDQLGKKSSVVLCMNGSHSILAYRVRMLVHWDGWLQRRTSFRSTASVVVATAVLAFFLGAVRLTTKAQASAVPSVADTKKRLDEATEATRPSSNEPTKSAAADEWTNSQVWICSLDLESSKSTRHFVVPNLASAGSLVVSPDGHRIAFDGLYMGREQLTETHLFVANVDGSELKDVGLAALPSWSPSSDKLVVSRYSPGGIWLMDLNGNFGNCLDKQGWGARWSPTGELIHYTKHNNGVPDFYIMDVQHQTTGPLFGAKGHPYERLLFSSEWTDDGNRILFKAVREDGSSEICSVSIQEPRDLQALYVRPTYANIVQMGSNRIVVLFRSKDFGTVQMHLVEIEKSPTADGDAQHLAGQFTDRNSYGATLSPDGRKIYYASAPAQRKSVAFGD